MVSQPIQVNLSQAGPLPCMFGTTEKSYPSAAACTAAGGVPHQPGPATNWCANLADIGLAHLGLLNCNTNVEPQGLQSPQAGVQETAGQVKSAITAPFTSVTDFLNRLWSDAFGNPEFWKSTGLLVAAAGLVVIGGFIWLRK